MGNLGEGRHGGGHQGGHDHQICILILRRLYECFRLDIYSQIFDLKSRGG